MDRIEIMQKLTEIAVDKLAVEAAVVKAESDIVKDLGADSLDLAEFVLEIETKFNIRIPDDEATGIITIGDAIIQIEKKLNQ